MSYHRGAVGTRLRVLSLRLSFGGDLSGGARGALRACVSHYQHIISTFLAGSMLELVGNPQECVYIMSLSHLEQLLE